MLELFGDVLKHTDAYVNPRLQVRALKVGPKHQYF